LVLKVVICKILPDKDLVHQLSKNGEDGNEAAGNVRYGRAALSVTAPIQVHIVASGGMGVCDGAHWVIVMKKSSWWDRLSECNGDLSPTMIWRELYDTPPVRQNPPIH